MGKTTGIQWAQATWNPFYGCTKVSEGCKNCYAEREMKRFGKDFDTITRSKTTFRDPLKWKESRMIFVCSWGDFFHPDVPRDWRNDAWNIMMEADQHVYLILTKRPQYFPLYLPLDWSLANPPNHIWFGVSAENQSRADERIPTLLNLPAKLHFVSMEPLLGPIRLADGWLFDYEWDRNPCAGDFIDWIITGGESGPNHRPCDLDWVRSIKDQCLEVGVAFFHKQHGGNRKIDGAWGGRELDGKTWDEIP